MQLTFFNKMIILVMRCNHVKKTWKTADTMKQQTFLSQNRY